MSDNKKYYYMRLKENFFDTNEIVVLESMQDGYLYSNILLKLYLRSLKTNGKLMFNDKIPYNSQMIATITRHQVGTVERALKIFEEMNLIEVLESGTIYLLDIQNFIGNSSTEADRKRKYRQAIDAEKATMDKCPDKSTPELELELEIEKELKIDKDKTLALSVANSQVEIITKDNSYYCVSHQEIDKWQNIYDCDVQKEIMKMAEWCKANPTKRKTVKGMPKFITNWLSRAKKEEGLAF